MGHINIHLIIFQVIEAIPISIGKIAINELLLKIVENLGIK